MTIKKSQKILVSSLLFVYLTMSSCSGDHSQEIAENINIEFELTYRYVTVNFITQNDYSDHFTLLKKNNQGAFTSIAYTWHSISLSQCEINESNQRESKKSGYERMTNSSQTNDILSRKIKDSERPCLANIYFDNWSNIQNMLLLSYPELQ